MRFGSRSKDILIGVEVVKNLHLKGSAGDDSFDDLTRIGKHDPRN